MLFQLLACQQGKKPANESTTMIEGEELTDEYLNEHRKKLEIQEKYLDKHVFYGLTNLNDGFDASGIKYFKEEDFATVLERVKKLKLGINGIEPWKNGEFYDVVTFEMVTTEPTDSNWYEQVFANFKEADSNLQYAATYYVPDELLND